MRTGLRTAPAGAAQLAAAGLLTLAGLALIACTPERHAGTSMAGGASGASALLIRGQIGPDTLILEPIFAVDAFAAPPPAGDGRHRLSGFDRAGDALFELSFDGVPVAGPADAEHFSLVVPLGDPDRLTRVVVQLQDGRTGSLATPHSAEEFAAAVADSNALSAARMEDGRIRLRWDADRFPMLMVRDVDSGDVLAFVIGGDAVVFGSTSELHVGFSDGVRSVGKRLRVD